ncbi:hypothetical protein LZK98_13970 [Sphingomonas cannabina]|uniref:hypothetical protein n=1 Tax=Sphingomonas cannabina TaxID=2899123 RepID=UPI001F3821A8|nr:hypothetical protein [Sphingomonas cannabina]UIJ44177.1 hypothetical protein LZK98_13970 [Sphingomonas cannabina]
MRAVSFISAFIIVGSFGWIPSEARAAQDNTEKMDAKNKERCANFGFREGTDAFANCVMQFSLSQERRQPPDHETLVRRYRDRSMARRGDDRYPVCTAGMMENELDISTGKWVGPNCQMAPD